MQERYLPNFVRALVLLVIGLILISYWEIGHTAYQSPHRRRFSYVTPDYRYSELPILKIDKNLTFGNGVNGTALLSGWSNPESWGVWSNGAASYLAFRLGSAAKANLARLVLRIVGRVYVVRYKLPSQRIRMWQNGKMIKDLTIKKSQTEV